MNISKIPALPPEGADAEQFKGALTDLRDELFRLQNILYASSSRALLIILQGLDASGKDSVIRHVFSAMNPQGVNVTSFKKPTEEENKHDFLWRIYPHFPSLGLIRVFNRSYYEDILQPVLGGTLDDKERAHRYRFINALEDHLQRNNTVILKFYLHISREEQADRIQKRLEKPHKRWKYDPNDLQSKDRYDEYIELYNDIFANTSECPWHIVPSDKKWYRNWFIAKMLRDTLKELDLKYPE